MPEIIHVHAATISTCKSCLSHITIYLSHVSSIQLFIWLIYSMTVAALEWIVLCSLIAAIAAKVWQAAALCGMHGGMAFHRNCQLLPHVWHTENRQIAPILSTEEKAVLFGRICYLEGYYHWDTQIWSEMKFTGLVLFWGLLFTGFSVFASAAGAGDFVRKFHYDKLGF
jgi:hypothetical protein